MADLEAWNEVPRDTKVRSILVGGCLGLCIGFMAGHQARQDVDYEMQRQDNRMPVLLEKARPRISPPPRYTSPSVYSFAVYSRRNR